MALGPGMFPGNKSCYSDPCPWQQQRWEEPLSHRKSNIASNSAAKTPGSHGSRLCLAAHINFGPAVFSAPNGGKPIYVVCLPLGIRSGFDLLPRQLLCAGDKAVKRHRMDRITLPPYSQCRKK